MNTPIALTNTRHVRRPAKIPMLNLRLVLGLSFALLVTLDAFAQQTVVENLYVGQASAQQFQTTTIPAQLCPTCAASGCASCQCPNPYQPAVQIQPYEQPVAVRGCYCENCMRGVDCAWKDGNGALRWHDAEPINFEPLRHGEWIGPVRIPAFLQYRVRNGDELQFVFVQVPAELTEPYRLTVGDELAIKSVSDDKIAHGDLQKGNKIQQDGKLYTTLLPRPIQAAGLTIPELRQVLEREYSEFIRNPAIDVLPVQTNTKLQYLNTAVSNFQTNGGQNISGIVNPDGNLQLPLIGSVRVIGMTLDEIKREVNLHYRQRGYLGIEIEPRLVRQAPHFVYVMGEVGRPGRIELLGPTTVTQALSMSEGIRVGGNMRQIVVFRRAEDWRLIATKIDLRAELLGKAPTPADEIWVRDSDLIIVPPQPIKVFDNWVKLVFTDGIYGIAPATLFSNNNGGGGGGIF